ncbi:hypothetical protein [Granulosicoccus antarcticus]|uniref:Uncharacterized protein n=1 Tax=Granulosicoccus antarcticus IMCC3135 TaxID=1192854 RepID=A0A2Z2NPL8_9GAMM|nr:hypothetical protein [Granulosicoccus antarcticus]ASJ71608.1 hypothetical protein IMCC3135_07515 [Granulosicoccus antarcticus IMCC3135]
MPAAVGSMTIRAAALAPIAANLNEKLDEVIVMILECKGHDIISRMGQSGIFRKPLIITRQMHDFIASAPVTMYAGALVSDLEFVSVQYNLELIGLVEVIL